MPASKPAAQLVGVQTGVKGAALPALNYQPSGSFNDIEKLKADLWDAADNLRALIPAHR